MPQAAALFALTPGCIPGDTSCTLNEALSLLHWLAAALGLLLIALIIFAVTVYRRNKHKKLTPHD